MMPFFNILLAYVARAYFYSTQNSIIIYNTLLPHRLKSHSKTQTTKLLGGAVFLFEKIVLCGWQTMITIIIHHSTNKLVLIEMKVKLRESYIHYVLQCCSN